MKFVRSLKKEAITNVVKIVSDKSKNSLDLNKDYEVQSNVISKKDIAKVLLAEHMAISNVKRQFLDTHHIKEDDFLQNYLNEFCYKYNR